MRQTAAAKAEEQLIRAACDISAPWRLFSTRPHLPWPDSTVPAPPMFLQDGYGHTTVFGCRMTHDTPVIHAGARVVVVGQKQELQTVTQTVHIRDTPMTVRDLEAIREDRPDLEDQERSAVLFDGEFLYPTISLVSYSRYEITFQLGSSICDENDLLRVNRVPCRVP